MVSPELFRKYPFFGFLDDSQLKSVAMISEEIVAEPDEILFRTATVADAIYFLIEGNVEHHYEVVDEINPELRKDFLVGEVNPGEVFGISALIEPFSFTTNARTATRSRIVRIDITELRALCDKDAKLAYGLMQEIARATMDRLETTRVLLAAARP